MSKIILSDDSLFSQIKDGVAKHHRLIVLLTFIISVVWILDRIFLDNETTNQLLHTYWDTHIIKQERKNWGVSFFFYIYIFAHLLICASYYQQRKTSLPVIDFYKFPFLYIKKQLLEVMYTIMGMIFSIVVIMIFLSYSFFGISPLSVSMIVALIQHTVPFTLIILFFLTLNLYSASVTDENHIPSISNSFHRLTKVFWGFFGKFILCWIIFLLAGFAVELLNSELLDITRNNSILGAVSWIVIFFTTYLSVYVGTVGAFSINTISSYYYVKSEYQS